MYVLDEINCLKGGKYDYVTELSRQVFLQAAVPRLHLRQKDARDLRGQRLQPHGVPLFPLPVEGRKGNYKFEGRFNQGVVSINLPQIGIIAKGDEDKFWKLFDERLELCREALMCRHRALLGTKSDVSPIHWQYGAHRPPRKGRGHRRPAKGGYSTLSARLHRPV